MSQKNLFAAAREAAGRLGDEVARSIPTLPKLDLAKRVEVPVYVVHNSTDPEDYFFLLDFETFLTESRRGIFVRPALKLWSGRSDFARRAFARKFRHAFSEEFERMMADKRAEVERKARRGWLSIIPGLDLVTLVGGGVIQTLVLFLAVTSGKAAWSEVTRILGAMRSGDAQLSSLRDQIEEKKKVIDAALEEIEVVLHRDLYVHAYRGTPPGPLTGMDYDAWPLPTFVREHLNDQTSTSWW